MKLKQTLHRLNNYIINHLKTYTIIFSVLLVVGIGVFLYYNFYQTIISAKKIIILQKDIAPAAINIKLLDKVEESYRAKQVENSYDWKQFNKLFSPIDNILSSGPIIENDIKPQTSF